MSELSYPYPTAPAPHGELLELAPGVLWLRMPLPLALDHINLYLLQDDDGWMIVDTGINNAATKKLWQQIFAASLSSLLGGQKISGVLCTHYHYDHAGLAGWLCDTLRVPLYMSYGEYYTLRSLAAAPADALPWEHLEYFQRCGFPAGHLDEVHQMLRMASQLVSPPPASFQRLRAGNTLTIGGRHWRLHLGEGHVAEHMLLHNTEDNILIAGDQLLPRITSNVSVLPTEPDADLMGDWLDSLKRLLQLPGDPLVLPAHELPYRGLPVRIQQLQAHHGRHFDRLRGFCQETELTAYQAMQQLFAHRSQLSPIDQMMALGECLAHLNYLWRRGEISRRLDEQGQYRYRTRAH